MNQNMPGDLRSFLASIPDEVFWVDVRRQRPHYNRIFTHLCHFLGRAQLTAPMFLDGTLPNLSTFQRSVAREAQLRRGDRPAGWFDRAAA